MQFRLQHLIWAMTSLCILIGLVFASPPVLSFPILVLLLFTIPGASLTGIIWGQRQKRAFFVGAGATAILPLFLVLIFTFPDMVYRGRNFDNSLWTPAMNSYWWTTNIVLITPVLAALLGGFAAVITYRFVVVQADKVDSPT